MIEAGAGDLLAVPGTEHTLRAVVRIGGRRVEATRVVRVCR